MKKTESLEIITDIVSKDASGIQANRDKIENIENVLMNCEEKLEMTVKHHFSKDCYGRELFIPEGTLLVGKIHKHQSINILALGEISLLTEEGSKRVKAPFIVVSNPGIKRVGYAHTDCVWVSVHGTKETELDKIEDEVIAKNYDEVQMLTENEIKELQRISNQEDL